MSRVFAIVVPVLAVMALLPLGVVQKKSICWSCCVAWFTENENSQPCHAPSSLFDPNATYTTPLSKSKPARCF